MPSEKQSFLLGCEGASRKRSKETEIGESVFVKSPKIAFQDLGNSEIDYQKLLEANEEIQKLKQEINKLTEQRERAATFTAESARRYREIVRFITGYDIKMRNEEYIEVCLHCVF